MFYHEIARTGADVQSRWLRIPAAIAYSGISRAGLYMLLRTGAIRSTMVCTNSFIRGIRVVDRRAIDAYLEGLMEGPLKMAPSYGRKPKGIQQQPKQRKRRERPTRGAQEEVS
jgi:hypothetical protein